MGGPGRTLILTADLLGLGLSREFGKHQEEDGGESLRAALVRAKEQVIQLGGDGAYRPLRVSRSDGSVRVRS